MKRLFLLLMLLPCLGFSSTIVIPSPRNPHRHEIPPHQAPRPGPGVVVTIPGSPRYHDERSYYPHRHGHHHRRHRHHGYHG